MSFRLFIIIKRDLFHLKKPMNVGSEDCFGAEVVQEESKLVDNIEFEFNALFREEVLRTHLHQGTKNVFH